MTMAKAGDTVKVHYTGKKTNGEVFDSSEGKAPLQFTIGQQQVISGFENGVIGMELNQTKTVHISVDDAYGPKFDDLIITVPPSQFAPGLKPVLGHHLEVKTKEGHNFLVRVIGITDTEITLDANHPLAGEELIFDITLVEITPGEPGNQPTGCSCGCSH
jgi:peptidylprolyl isomerase